MSDKVEMPRELPECIEGEFRFSEPKNTCQDVGVSWEHCKAIYALAVELLGDGKADKLIAERDHAVGRKLSMLGGDIQALIKVCPSLQDDAATNQMTTLLNQISYRLQNNL